MIAYNVIGLMSGTSLDGLDLVYCEFKNPGDFWEYKILGSKTVAYDPQMREDLRQAIYLPPEELAILHIKYGQWLGEQVLEFINAGIYEVDFISSHGHTIHHQPDQGITVQIGHGQHIANRTGLETICDFRTLDVSHGGQGAPLVPIGDQLLFGAFDYCVNLGGISNLSFSDGDRRIAFDVGIANMLLNYLAGLSGKEYDDKGKMASRGSLDHDLLHALNNLKYYSRKPPKSTGFEWFEKEVKPVVNNSEARMEDKLHTAVVHISQQLALQLQPFLQKEITTVLLTGGGVYNDFLIEELRNRVDKRIQLFIPETALVSFKEALVFAFMGVLRKEGRINVLESVTGAVKDTSSGEVFVPEI